MSERKWWIKKEKYLDKYDGLRLCMGDGQYDKFFLGDKELEFILKHLNAIIQYVETNELPDEVAPPEPGAAPEPEPDEDKDDLPF